MVADFTDPDPYAGYRFPTAMIHHALWLLNRFNLSSRRETTIHFKFLEQDRVSGVSIQIRGKLNLSSNN
jgi:hypothetical protein